MFAKIAPLTPTCFPSCFAVRKIAPTEHRMGRITDKTRQLLHEYLIRYFASRGPGFAAPGENTLNRSRDWESHTPTRYKWSVSGVVRTFAMCFLPFASIAFCFLVLYLNPWRFCDDVCITFSFVTSSQTVKRRKSEHEKSGKIIQQIQLTRDQEMGSSRGLRTLFFY